jgi:hypothetical protein
MYTFISIILPQETYRMLQAYVTDIADQMGIQLSRVSVIEGRAVGCLDAYLLHLASDNQKVSVLVYLPELDNLQQGSCCDRLELKIRSALLRLQMMQEQ